MQICPSTGLLAFSDAPLRCIGTECNLLLLFAGCHMDIIWQDIKMYMSKWCIPAVKEFGFYLTWFNTTVSEYEPALRFWYLSRFCATKAHESLHKCADLLEPLLLPCSNYECKWRFRPKLWGFKGYICTYAISSKISCAGRYRSHVVRKSVFGVLILYF